MPTYVPSDATDYCATMVKNMPFMDVRSRAADTVQKIIWMAAPWRWTLGALDNITVTSNTQDYAFTKPADFLWLERSYIWDGSKEIPLRVEAFLPPSPSTKNVPSRIAYVSSSGDKLRLYPSPQVNANSVLVNLYKKAYTPITETNIGVGGSLIMPDEWTWVFEAGCLWQAYLYADDARAGSAAITNDGKRQYSGQLGVFMSAIQEMREAEKPFLDTLTFGDKQRG
jgi:hypothetical protein